jgi:hypothetical protein
MALWLLEDGGASMTAVTNWGESAWDLLGLWAGLRRKAFILYVGDAAINLSDPAFYHETPCRVCIFVEFVLYFYEKLMIFLSYSLLHSIHDDHISEINADRKRLVSSVPSG